jgi:uncharacterized membrane protein
MEETSWHTASLAAWIERDSILSGVEAVVLGVELLGVAIVLVAIVLATVEFIRQRITRAPAEETYQHYRVSLARGLLLGLEILIAADVIRTVTEQLTLDGVLTLGLLVLVRTFLTWSLVVEIEQRWPWNAASPSPHELFDSAPEAESDAGDS